MSTNRQPAGQPTGGQFAATEGADGELELMRTEAPWVEADQVGPVEVAPAGQVQDVPLVMLNMEWRPGVYHVEHGNALSDWAYRNNIEIKVEHEPTSGTQAEWREMKVTFSNTVNGESVTLDYGHSGGVQGVDGKPWSGAIMGQYVDEFSEFTGVYDYPGGWGEFANDEGYSDEEAEAKWNQTRALRDAFEKTMGTSADALYGWIDSGSEGDGPLGAQA